MTKTQKGKPKKGQKGNLSKKGSTDLAQLGAEGAQLALARDVLVAQAMQLGVGEQQLTLEHRHYDRVWQLM